MRPAVLSNVQRLVVKLGTGVLTDARKRPDPLQFTQLVTQIAQLRAIGKEVVVVTSGAVGAGMGALGFQKRPTQLAELQACAAIGQSRLMAMYESLFRHHELGIAQVLLTHDDLADHTRHLNARNTLRTLLKGGVVPIINENDAVSVTELKFGDNDRLSALVAALLPADLLVILTTADGLIQDYGTPQARLLSTVDRIDDGIEGMGGGTTSATAVGGMATKIQAAKIVGRSGIPLVIASGRRFDGLSRILSGEPEGTLFLPSPKSLSSRKRWIAFFDAPRGRLHVDNGARIALEQQGSSLLAAGVTRIEGAFEAEQVVSILDPSGREFARGLVTLSHHDLAPKMKASRTEVVHRDNLVVL